MRRYRVRILGNVLLQYGYIGLGLQCANDHPPAHLTTSSYINLYSVHMLPPSLGLVWLDCHKQHQIDIFFSGYTD